MRKTIVIMAMASFMFQSCATILDGNKTRIVVKGNVPATIYYNGEKVGSASARDNALKQAINKAASTNMSTQMAIKDKLRIKKTSIKAGGKLTIKAEGYESQDIMLYRKARIGFVLMDVVCGIVPLGVDVVNGNIYGVKPRTVSYNLQKK